MLTAPVAICLTAFVGSSRLGHMSEEAEQPDEQHQPLKLVKRRAKFKAAKTTPEDRRSVRMLTSKSVSVCLHIEAAKREVSISALLLDACRRSFPAVAAALESKKRAG